MIDFVPEFVSKLDNCVYLLQTKRAIFIAICA